MPAAHTPSARFEHSVANRIDFRARWPVFQLYRRKPISMPKTRQPQAAVLPVV